VLGALRAARPANSGWQPYLTVTNRQGASVDDLLLMEKAGVVEAAVPGLPLELSKVNWFYEKSNKPGRSRVGIAIRITQAGVAALTDQPEIMILESLGRDGRHRYQIRDVARISGHGGAGFDEALKRMEQQRLIVATDEHGELVVLAKLKAGQFSARGVELRLSITRKGCTFIYRP
jgi:hypothetical protein